MRARLKYLGHDILVPEGRFIIGRSSECHLSLNDDRASRKHAALVVRAGRVLIEDLGSRNGLTVNDGIKVDGSRELLDGDEICIGSQKLTLHLDVDAQVDSREAPTGLLPPEDAWAPMGDPMLEEADFVGEATSTSIQTFSSPANPPDERVDALSLVGGLADKALALGRGDEAERLLRRSLLDILGKAQGGQPVPLALAERAATYSVRLADAARQGNWVNYVFQLYTALGYLLPGRVVDDLYKVMGKVKVVDLATLARYTALLRTRPPTSNPTERFVQQRIEALERQCAQRT